MREICQFERDWYLTPDNGLTMCMNSEHAARLLGNLLEKEGQLEEYTALGKAVMEKLAAWIGGSPDRVIAVLRGDAEMIAFDRGESACTVICDTIADTLEAGNG